MNELKARLKTCFTYMIFCVIIYLFVRGTIGFQPIQTQKLKQIDYNVQINQDGSINVKETWKVYVRNTNTLYKTFEKNEKFTDVKVTEIDNKNNKIEYNDLGKWAYHADAGNYYGALNDNKKFEIGWGTGLEESKGTKTYEIEYKVLDVIEKGNDSAEFYWQFISNTNSMKVKKITGTVSLPKALWSAEDIKVWGHTDDLNGEIYITDDDTVKFEIKKLNAYKKLEVRIAFPTNLILDNVANVADKDILPDILKQERVWAESSNRKREQYKKELRGQHIVLCIVTGVIAIIVIKQSKKSYVIIEKNKNNKITPTVDYDYYREIPDENATPLEAGALIVGGNGRIPNDDIGNIISATILNLKLKGVLKFEIDNNLKEDNNVEIILNELMVRSGISGDEIEKESHRIIQYKDELEPEEVKVYGLLNSVKKYYGKITNKTIKKYARNEGIEVIQSLFNAINDIAKQRLITKKLIDKDKKKQYDSITKSIEGNICTGMFLFMAFVYFVPRFYDIIFYYTIVMYLMLVFNGIMLSKTAKSVNAYTQEGIDEGTKWKALKKYLEEFSLIDERNVPEIEIWEKYLVYATAFGIADKVLKQIKMVYPEIDDVSSVSYTSFYVAHSFNSNNFAHTFNSAYSTAVSHSSSGSGGGGGFSGGGGGGGGGRKYGWQIKLKRRQHNNYDILDKIKYLMKTTNGEIYEHR